MNKLLLLMLVTIIGLSTMSCDTASADENRLHVPDLTQGDTVPARHKHDWNLGPVGLRGWMFCDQLVTTDARQIAITAVDSGSPAAGILSVGDVILGVGGRRFAYDPRTEFGLAVSAAETETEKGRLVLTRWRDGQIEDVTLT
ncbi:MAG: DUF6288 domain-containing protein, partial [Planctomyces sp.]